MNIMALRRSLVVRSRRRALSIVHASRSKTFLRKIELSAFSRSTNPFPRMGNRRWRARFALGDGNWGHSFFSRFSEAIRCSFSVFQAEAVALLVGLRWAQDVGLPVEKVFFDSLSLVSALEGQTVYLNELGVIFSDIKVLLSSFSGASLSH
ncbi:hypothetical protein CsatA_025200 [Cannabis sativa]